MSAAPGGAPRGAASDAATLHVTVNGEPRELPASTTLASLLATLGVRADRCAAEVNREIVPRSLHAARALREGDEVEVVTFVGGG